MSTGAIQPTHRVPPLNQESARDIAVPMKEGKFWELYERRRNNNQDLVVIIADHQNRRGTGKSTLSVKLADEMDCSGGITMDKCALDPVAIRDAYTDEPTKSSLLMDEAEAGIGNRESMTLVNRALMEIMSMGRVEEKYLVMNAPNANRIDKGVRELCDVLMLVQARGRARVYRYVNNPFENRVYHSPLEVIHWEPIRSQRLQEVYDDLDAEKKRKLRGEDGADLIRESEVDKMIRTEKKEFGRELRDEMIVELLTRYPDLSYKEVADHLPEEISASENMIGKVWREYRDG